MVGTIKLPSGVVSTHSRLKAAGDGRGGAWFRGAGFNTQPPEGGWGCTLCVDCQEDLVSTHSRLKAAGRRGGRQRPQCRVSTHSRLKAAGTANGKNQAQELFQHTAA